MKLLDIVSMLKGRFHKKKLRTALAITGITVGVMSVTAITSLGNSGERAVFLELSKLGIHGVNLQKQLSKAASYTGIEYSDVTFLKEIEPELLISGVYTNAGKLRCGDTERDAAVFCVDSDFSGIASMDMVSGRFLSDSDNRYYSNVCVIDNIAAEQLFPGESPLGKTIRLSTVSGENSFSVCGIVKDNGGIIGESMPICLYIPANCVRQVFHTSKLDYISMMCEDETILSEKSQLLLNRLEEHKNVSDFFYVDNINDRKKQVESATGLVKSIIGAIAMISLAVGGIGVMNLMLVTVAERTREIGVKKSIGAKNTDILLEFLAEAVVITLFAGILGIVGGVGISLAVSAVLQIPYWFQPLVLLRIFLISFATGVVFGGYPALVAACQDPVKALRYE